MSVSKTMTAARRVQYAALPFRCRVSSSLQVMLVTSRDTGRWVIPKGWPVGRKAPHASAAREAREEAGLVGTVGKDPIGIYSYKKRLGSGAFVTCDVRVFPLEVKRQQKHWPEKGEREFRWFSPARAANAVKEPALRAIIRNFSKVGPSLSTTR